MSDPVVILAPNANALKHARRVAGDLSKLGFQVAGCDGRITGAEVDQAHKVVLLWSGGQARGPALRAAARRAKANGKLVTVRLDATRPPKEAGRALKLPRGKQTTRAWQRLLGPQAPTPTQTPIRPAPRKSEKRTRPIRERKAAALTPAPAPKPQAIAAAPTPRVAVARPAPAPISEKPKKRGMGAFGVLAATLCISALIAIAAGAVFYVRDASFAALVNAFAASLN
ncbi:hypothetical protein [Vitreimonas flagellata]|uniref:hypothetical protein n=1 Tax=Vitreimonas flagellata TaxID=2560861 RepID=UPI001430A3BD|nr:hypothetical protein [Vitreimonas flagellata]